MLRRGKVKEEHLQKDVTKGPTCRRNKPPANGNVFENWFDSCRGLEGEPGCGWESGEGEGGKGGK